MEFIRQRILNWYTMLQVFLSLRDVFEFGRYRWLSLSDVLELNPDYVKWCMYHVSFPFYLSKDTLLEIEQVYPLFLITRDFMTKYKERSSQIIRCNQIERNEENSTVTEMDDAIFNSEFDNESWDIERMRYEEEGEYERYGGTYVQDVMDWSDEDIDDVLDGEPDAYWNID